MLSANRAAEPHHADARRLEVVSFQLLLVGPQRLVAVPQVDVGVEDADSRGLDRRRQRQRRGKNTIS
jgi:hypothetical protein